MASNGKAKPNGFLVNGVEVAYPDGHYELRPFEGSKAKWTRSEGNVRDLLPQYSKGFGFTRVWMKNSEMLFRAASASRGEGRIRFMGASLCGPSPISSELCTKNEPFPRRSMTRDNLYFSVLMRSDKTRERVHLNDG